MDVMEKFEFVFTGKKHERGNKRSRQTCKRVTLCRYRLNTHEEPEIQAYFVCMK